MEDEYGAMDAVDLYFVVPALPLESGLQLREVRVAYRTWGTLSPGADNCIFVPHALTGNAAVDSWWGALLGEGKAFDTSKYFIVGANMLGSCYGTTSPLDDMPEAEGAAPWVAPRVGTHREDARLRYAADFPHVTIRDNVRLHHRLLTQHLGVHAMHAVVGGSAGGMQALEWAIMFPSFVRRAVVIACGATQTPWQIAISEAQRQSIYRDPNWNHGFYSLNEPPEHGLAVARQNAMVWYRSPEAYEEKFGRQEQVAIPGSPAAKALANAGGGGRGAPSSFAVEGYLEHQGAKFVDRFDANCYVALTRTLDSHDVSSGGGGPLGGEPRASVAEVLQGIVQPVMVVGISSDVLYPLYMQHELARHIPRATLRVVESSQGHDAFLLESGVMSEYISEGLMSKDEAQEAAGEVSDGWTQAAPALSHIDVSNGEGVPSRAPVPSPKLTFTLLPTAEVLGRLTAEAIAKRKAANVEANRTAGCLGAVAW